jgi:hypothetical protein
MEAVRARSRRFLPGSRLVLQVAEKLSGHDVAPSQVAQTAALWRFFYGKSMIYGPKPPLGGGFRCRRALLK